MIEINKGASSFPADETERQAARSDGGINILVEAGAGTGKTSVLVERILSIITAGKATIERIVAITFTEKAAAEMVVRMRDRLERFVLEGVAPVEDLEYAQTALQNFENHRISTIHSFAGSILRETPFEAGVDPSYEIIEEAEEREIIDELWESWIERQLKNTDSPFYIGYHLELRTDFFKKLFDKVYENRYNLADFLPSGAGIDESEYENSMRVIVEQLVELAQCCLSEDDKGYGQIRNFARDMEFLLKRKGLEKTLSLLTFNIGRTDAGDAKLWAGNKPRKTELCKALKETLMEFRHTYTRWLLDNCISALLEFTGELDYLKTRRRVLTHDDILTKARNLLRDNRRVRELFKRKFDRILVDEFQDTDPLQAEIVFFLSEEKGTFETNWEQCRLEPGKLFLVGDPKQSIYSFRRADIEIYERVKTEFRHTGKVGRISVNFRTLSPIITWVNEQFSRLIKKPEDGEMYQPDYEPLIPHRKEAQYPSLWLLKPDKEIGITKTVGNTRIIMAEASCDFIRELVEEKKLMIKLKDGHEQPVCYGDIAILFPTYSYMPVYEEALRKRGIPFLLEGGRQFYERPEIREILTALKAIDNPRDEIAVVATLKSSLFGLSDEDLLTMKIRGIPFCYQEASHGEHPASEAFHVLQALHGLKSQVSTGRLLEELYEKTLIRELCITVHTGDRRTANLDKFLLIARQFDRTENGTLRSFIRRVESEPEMGTQEPDAHLAEPGTDAVQLLTYHKSKGLEYPVLVLAVQVGKSTRTRRDSGILFDGEENRFEICCEDSGLETAGHEELKKLDKLKYEAEETRLLYVACTRARDLLVIPAFFHVKPKEEKAEPGAVEGDMVDAGTLTKKKSGKSKPKEPFSVESSFVQKQLAETIGDGMPSGSGEDGAEIIPLLSRNFQVVTCTGEMLQKNHVPMEEIRFDGRETPALPVFTDDFDAWLESRKEAIGKGSWYRKSQSYTAEKQRDEENTEEVEDTGKRIGRAFHGVMSTLDLTGKLPFDDLVNLACQEEKVPENKQEIVDMIETTLKSKVLQRMRNAGVCRREFNFNLHQPQGDFQGVIDALWREGEEYIILDYKTDKVTPQNAGERAREEYGRQAEIYRQAIEHLTGKRVKEVIFYFTRVDEAVTV